MSTYISPMAKIHLAKTTHYKSYKIENEVENIFSGDIVDVLDNVIINDDYNYATTEQERDFKLYLEEANLPEEERSQLVKELDTYLAGYTGQSDGIYFRARDLLRENICSERNPYNKGDCV